MAYIWFQLILEALGKRLNYEALSNLYGNAFAKDASKAIMAANPLTKNGMASSGASVMDLKGKITIVNAPKTKELEKEAKEIALKSAEKALGDLSWAEGIFSIK